MKQFIKRHPALVFFAITIAWIWISMPVLFGVLGINVREDIAVQHVILIFLVNSPSVFGILLTGIVDGREGLKALFSRAVQWRVKPVWYAAALLVPIGAYALNYVVQGLLGGSLAPINVAEKLSFAIPTALMACLLEEFGWRGFAQPRLQRRYSALASSLIVGLCWGLWHTPINYLGLSQYGAMVIPLLIVNLLLPLSLAVILGWVHNNTQGSMLLVLLGHFGTTFGVTFFGLPSSTTATSELRALSISVAIHVLTVIVIVASTGAGAKRLVRASRSAQQV